MASGSDEPLKRSSSEGYDIVGADCSGLMGRAE